MAFMSMALAAGAAVVLLFLAGLVLLVTGTVLARRQRRVLGNVLRVAGLLCELPAVCLIVIFIIANIRY